MPSRILELALVGYGHLARRYYLPALRGRNDIRISLVIDPLDASRAAARSVFPEAATGEDASLLTNRRLDGILVASPPSTHFDLWQLGAQADIPVFLEKPFVLRGQLQNAVAG